MKFYYRASDAERAPNELNEACQYALLAQCPGAYFELHRGFSNCNFCGMCAKCSR